MTSHGIAVHPDGAIGNKDTKALKSTLILTSLLLWAAISQGAERASWVTSGFEDFSKGNF